MSWLTDKLWIKSLICHHVQVPESQILFSDHHLSHAASAFFCSPFERSAILTADTYVRELKFVSIGTNDLLQYTLAADRGNPALERYRDSLHPALLQLVRLAVEAAERAQIELSICGEMAGEPVAALVLVGLGVRMLSVSPSSIAAVRRALRGAALRDLERIAAAALGDASAADVRRRLKT